MLKTLKPAIFLIAMLFSIFLSTETAYGTIKMQPYLQAVTQNSVYVMVVCDSKYNVVVDYGKSQQYGNNAKTESFVKTHGKSRYVHRVKLDGLEAGQEYHYKVSQGRQEWKNESFKTAALDGQPFKFGIFGDCRSFPKTHAKVITGLKKMEPDFSLYTGDICNDPKYSTWIREFFIDEQLDLIKNAPFFNSIGNHEGWAQNTKAFLQAPESESGHQAYYSFEYGNMFVLVLSSEHDIKEGSDQYEFAKKALAGTDKKWKVALWHIPAYGAGGHGESKNMINFTKSVADPAGVDVVFNGHSHFYQHNHVNGARHIIFGGGGASLYSPKEASYTVKSVKQHNFGLAEITKDSFKITAYNIDGEVIDKIEIIK